MTPEEREAARQKQLERDQRTVFVGQLVMRANERKVQKYFEAVGPVVNVKLIKDRGGFSKGFGYVEFEKLESVPVTTTSLPPPLSLPLPNSHLLTFPLPASNDAERHALLHQARRLPLLWHAAAGQGVRGRAQPRAPA